MRQTAPGHTRPRLIDPLRDPHGFVPLGSVHLVVLAGAIALGTGGALTAANQQDALTNGVELVELAHAQARTTALRTGRSVRLAIQPAEARIRVTYATLDAPRGDPLIREVRPPAVTLDTDVTTLCFDGLGRAFASPGCDPHTGTIEVRVLTGSAPLTLTPDGRLTR